MIRFDLTPEQLIDLLEYRELRARGALGFPHLPLAIGERLKLSPREVAQRQARTMWDEVKTIAFDPSVLEKARSALTQQHNADTARRELGWLQSQFPEAFEQHRVERERDLENELARLLTEAGFEVQRQVHTDKGIADIVVGDYVIEVKIRVQTWSDLHRAAGQARAYAETLGKPKALVAAASLGPKIKLVDTDVPCLPLGKVVDHLKAA